MNEQIREITPEDVASLASAAFDAAWDLSGEGYNGEYLRTSAVKRFQEQRTKAIMAVIKKWWEEGQ